MVKKAEKSAEFRDNVWGYP